MEHVSDSREEFRSVTGAVSRCAAGMICHLRSAVEIARRMSAARAQVPCGLRWMPSLLKNDAHYQRRLKLEIKTKIFYYVKTYR